MKNNLQKPASRLSPTFIVFLLMCIFFMIAFLSSLGLSPTVDESSRVMYGVNILNGNASRLDLEENANGPTLRGSDMPIIALNAIPQKLGGLLPEGLPRSILESSFPARAISIAVSMAIAILIFSWARALYGLIPAFASLLLYIFDPNIIAHSQIIGTDLYAWGTTLLIFYSAWNFAKQRTLKNLMLFGASLGIGLIAKYTTILYIPLTLLTLLICDAQALTAGLKKAPSSTIKSFLQNYFLYTLVLLAISWFVVSCAFLFEDPFVRFGDYKFHSNLFQGIKSGLPWLSNLRIPTPYPYLQGFDLTYFYSESGIAYGNIYLFGELRDGTDGFNGYYLIASFFKTPIAAQLIVLGTFYVYLSSKARRQRFFSDEIFLLLPTLFFAVYFNFMFNINTGIRYYLVFFPLLYVFCGSLFTGWETFSKLQKSASLLLIVYLAASTISYFPNYMPYFNEFLLDRKMAYKILADSNIDYGQGEYKLDAFLDAHPEAVYNPQRPTSGMIVASINEMVGVYGKDREIIWLRENFEPDDTIAYTYLVYSISTEEIESLCQTTEYCK